MSDNKRYLFTSLMGCTGTAIVNTPRGNIEIENQKMTAFLVRNIEGFRSEWNKFVTERSPRVHKLLERADMHGDIDTTQMLLAGKRTPTGDVDSDQVAFLQFYITHAQICFHNLPALVVWKRGMHARIQGLRANPELNGSIGVLLGECNTETSRAPVTLVEPSDQKGKRINVKAANLQLIT